MYIQKTPKIDSYTSPLRLGLDPITCKTDLRIDPTKDLDIANVNAKQLTALNSLPNGGNVTTNATNSGQTGYASLYLAVSKEAQGANEIGQIFVGQTS